MGDAADYARETSEEHSDEWEGEDDMTPPDDMTTFYRMFGVFSDGGTMTRGEMLEAGQLPESVADWIRKNPNLVHISIIKVEK